MSDQPAQNIVPSPCAGRLLIFVLALLLLPASLRAENQPLILNTSNAAPRSTPDGTGFLDLVVKEALRRAGLSAVISHQPSERALANVNSGQDDGNFARVAGLEGRYPNLVRVPEALTILTFTPFARPPGPRIRDWADLEPYNVGHVIGWKILEDRIPQAKSLTRVKDGDTLFDLLAKGRIDVAVYDLLQGREIIRRGNLTVVPLDPPLARKEMFLYLNRRHEALVPVLAQTLRDMKQDGTYRTIMAAYPGAAAWGNGAAAPPPQTSPGK
jgi:polar amino acid transport system substrate-binding protein